MSQLKTTPKCKPAPAAAPEPLTERSRTAPEPPARPATIPENVMGALIDPMGGNSQPLTATEYSILVGCLLAYRSDDENLSETAEAFARLREFPDAIRFNALMGWICSSVRLRDGVEIAGMVIARRLAEPILFDCVYDDATTAAVIALVEVLRAGGWFAQWLRIQIMAAADDTNGHPTPLQVMSGLTLDLAEFETKRKAAAEVRDSYPHLFPTEGTIQ